LISSTNKFLKRKKEETSKTKIFEKKNEKETILGKKTSC